MKRILLIVLTSLLILIFPQSLFAAGFQLKTVGGMNVEGVTYNQLWYTNTNVTFTGITTANAAVTVNINGTSGSTTADASGNWSYTATLNEGDNSVSFTSNESTISFTLTVGEVPEGVGGLPEAETPTVGTIEPTVIFILLGVVSISSAIFLLGKRFAQA